MTLRLYADGARNDATNVVGWAYSLMDGNTVLLAECGQTRGCATDGEYLAVIYGLLALPHSTPVVVVTDRYDIGQQIVLGEQCDKGLFTTENKKHMAQRKTIKRLATREVLVEVVKSGEDKVHGQMDTLARYACGLPSKRERDWKRQYAKNKRRAARKHRVRAEARDCFRTMSLTIKLSGVYCGVSELAQR